VHRLAPAIVVLVLLTACGKRVPVAPSAASPRNASELQGLASYYAEGFNGRPTASGEIFDSYKDMTAAHRTLPFNTVVKVTNQENGRNVDVRINDRGPFVEGRVIDLSMNAARELDMVRSGVVPVKLTVLREGQAPPAKPRGETQPPNAPAVAYTIQVGAFGSQEAAEALKKDLEGRYKNVTIQTVTTPQTLYRVRVGRLADLNSAEDLMKLLREEKFDPFVVRLN
jgi:peptidoglycan lytic transglycosylase